MKFSRWIGYLLASFVCGLFALGIDSYSYFSGRGSYIRKLLVESGNFDSEELANMPSNSFFLGIWMLFVLIPCIVVWLVFRLDSKR